MQDETTLRLKGADERAAAHGAVPGDSSGGAFAIASGIEPAQAENARSMIAARLPILSPEEDEQLVRDAGFSGVNLLYAGLAFRSWVAYA